MNITPNIMKIIAKIWQNNGNKQKLVTIPKNCDLQPGDKVTIEKYEEEE